MAISEVQRALEREIVAKDARIAELERERDTLRAAHESLRSRAEQHEDRIDALERQQRE